MHRLELELVIDSFAGGGGASLGIEEAIGRPVDIAINHDRAAIAMHEANHPATRHYQEDVWQVDPVEATGGRPVALLLGVGSDRHPVPATRAAEHMQLHRLRSLRPAIRGHHTPSREDTMSEEDNEPYGTCDWGGCDDEVVRWRYSEEMGVHLPVCPAHSLEATNASLRAQADALAEALAEVCRETKHINTRRGSRNGRIGEVVEAALRAYQEGRDE